VILDVFSRYVVGWTIQYRETARIAEQLLAQVIEQQGIQPRQLTVQADPCYGRPLASSTPAVPVGSIEKALDGNRVPVIWDAGDCISDFFEQASETSVLPIWRWIARIDRVSTRSFEKELLTSASHVTVAAERDRLVFAGAHALGCPLGFRISGIRGSQWSRSREVSSARRYRHR
jgi:hypothetical protein